MTDENISIVIQDEVAASIGTKLDAITAKALAGARAVEQLQKAVKGTGSLGRIEAEALRQATAQQRLAAATQRTATAATQGNTAQQVLAAATARTATATAQAAIAQQNLATAQNRTATAAAQAAAAQTRAQIAAQRLAQSQNAATATSNRMSVSLSGLARTALAGAGVSLGAQQVVDYADSYTVLQNKLRNVASDQANLNFLTEEMFKIANETRTSVLDTAQAYQRFDLALKGLGKSQEDSLKLTRTVNTLLLTSGATTIEQSAALLQLSQAFNKGKLDGDEFRTVMELMPAAADAIAKSLKVTRGELLELAPTGVITSKVMFEAFDGLAQQMDQRLAGATMTVSQAFTVLRNNAIETFGEFNKATGITNALAQLIVGIGNNIGTLSIALTAISAVILSKFVPAIAASTVALLASPIGAVVAGITALTAAYIALKPETEEYKNSVVGLNAELAKQSEILDNLEKRKQNGGGIKGSASAQFADAQAQRQELAALKAINDTRAKLNASSDLKIDTPDLIAPFVEAFTVESEYLNKTFAARKAASEKAARLLEESLDKADKLTRDEYADRLYKEQQFQDALLLLQRNGRINAQEAAKRTEARSLQEVEVTATKKPETDALDQYNIELDRYNQLLGMSAKQREIAQRYDAAETKLLKEKAGVTQSDLATLYKSIEATYAHEQASQALDEAYASTAGAAEQFSNQLFALNQLMKDGWITAGQTVLAYNDMFGGLLQGTQEYTQAVIDEYERMHKEVDKMNVSAATKEAANKKLNVKQFMELNSEKLSALDSFFGATSNLMNSQNRKEFEAGKAAAIAQATLSAGTAIMNAYATSPWYVGLAQGAAAAAMLYSQISQIKNTQFQGFAKGGYTGNMPRNAVAGAVHGQEYVFDAASTSRIGVSNLEAMRKGAVSVSGDYNSGKAFGGMSEVSIVVNNLGTPQKYEVESITRDEIRIIARDEAKGVVSKETPNIVASEISQPNSKVSKSLRDHTETARRR